MKSLEISESLEPDRYNSEEILVSPNSSMNDLLITNSNYGTFSYSDSISFPVNALESSILGMGESGQLNKPVLSLKAFRDDKNKVVIPKLRFPVKSFLNNKEGIIAFLDEEIKIVSTDSAENNFYVNSFYFSRKIVLMDEHTSEVKEVLIELGDNSQQYDNIDNLFFSANQERLVFQEQNNVVVVNLVTGEMKTIENRRAPTVSPNGILFSYYGNNGLSLYNSDTNIEEDLQIYSTYNSYSLKNKSDFSANSDKLLYPIIEWDNEIQRLKFEELSLSGEEEGKVETIFDLEKIFSTKNKDRTYITVSRPAYINDSEFIFLVNYKEARYCD